MMGRGGRQKGGVIARRTLIAVGMLLAWGPRAWALDPALDVSQYAHTAWKIREGFTKGMISSIAQTPDGYLWIGTEFGLLRFDGIRAVPWKPPAGEDLPSSYIRSLFVARDGTLWIGTLRGLASWKDSRLTQHPELTGKVVDTLLEDREGTIWASANGIPSGGFCGIQSSGVQCYGEDGRFGKWVEPLYEDSEGSLWAATGTGLWRWKPGPPKHFSFPDLVGTSQALIESQSRGLLIATRTGIQQLVDEKAGAYPLPGVVGQFTPLKLLRDRDGGLWIGTYDRGLLHVHGGRTDVFTQPDSLSGDTVTSLFEDREGNVWVATSDGLDRFRDFAVATISVKQGLSSASVWSLLASKDGSVWLGSSDGLNRWEDGQITIYRKRSVLAPQSERRVSDGFKREKEPGGPGAVRQITGSGLPDGVQSLAQDGEGIWVSTHHGVAYLENGRFISISGVPGGQGYSITADSVGDLWVSHDEGLFHLRGRRVVEQIPWATLGRKEAAISVLPDPLKGGLWLGFHLSGMAYFKDGQVRGSYAAADGLGEGNVSGFKLERDGTLWVATEGGLSWLKNGRMATLTSENGLPCDAVNWVVEDDEHSFWLYMACGLVRVARSELSGWAAAVDRDKDAKPIIQATVFDNSDGVRGHAFAGGYSPRVAKAADGKLWFLPFDGVSVIDPRHLPFNKLAPPVHIEQIIADGKTHWQNWSGDAASAKPKLPPLVRDLEIDYTALSLVAPEKVRFRYKLEGLDRDWQDVGNRRQAFYTNLGPRKYRFRVMACNNSGVWNEAGTFLDFSIAPAYYQTRWFQLSCVATFLVLLLMLYRMRLRQVARQFNMRLEERVNERTRIARDLHDTLLQSFHGLLLRFQTAYDLFPTRPDEAQKTLGSAIDQAAQAITEGRDAVQGLRSSTVVTNDLAQAINTLGEELAAGETNPNSAVFHVGVEGTTRDLHPILRDEVYRIAGEAMRNAFKHAQAQRIEVEIRYDERQFRLRVRDDGQGIDSKLLDEDERPGHYGMRGMRERGKLLGGKLTVWSEVETGTEVELSIPAANAYATADGRGRSWLAEKFAGKLVEKDTERKS
jgi:signal transduction histidine kinase/ligand-binding sensor domain-containing protein